jgi:hypothetical protein
MDRASPYLQTGDKDKTMDNVQKLNTCTTYIIKFSIYLFSKFVCPLGLSFASLIWIIA